MSCLSMQFICSKLEDFECSMRIKMNLGDLQSCAESTHTWSTYLYHVIQLRLTGGISVIFAPTEGVCIFYKCY
jgi:hypothetical protein